MAGGPFWKGEDEVGGVDQDDHHEAREQDEKRIAQGLGEAKFAE
jgi:hypothetical protein